MNERVLIVAKTHMYSDACVGGISADGESLRLLGPQGEHQPEDTPFDVGQVWEITYRQAPARALVPPHVEDVYITSQQYEKTIQDMQETLLKMVQPWQGPIQSLFSGMLGFTSRGSGFIQRDSGVPDRSTWFWELDADMELDSADRRYYRYHRTNPHKIKYVGYAHPLPRLKRGQLLRISLARWWQPQDAPDLPERCYLQLSGWY